MIEDRCAFKRKLVLAFFPHAFQVLPQPKLNFRGGISTIIPDNLIPFLSSYSEELWGYTKKQIPVTEQATGICGIMPSDFN